mgnify:CR=1 FL=1
MLDPEMFSYHGMFVFFYALMEVAASVPNISCIAQISCEFIHYTSQIILHTQITCEFTYCTSQMLLIKNSLFTLSHYCLQRIDVFFLLVVILGFMGRGLSVLLTLSTFQRGCFMRKKYS